MLNKMSDFDEYINKGRESALAILTGTGRTYDAATAVSEQDLVDPRICKILAIIREVEAQPRNWEGNRSTWIRSVAMRHSVQWQSIYRWMKKQ